MSWGIEENRFLEFFAETKKSYRDEYFNRRIRNVDLRTSTLQSEIQERVARYEDELEECSDPALNLYYIGFCHDEKAYNDRLADLQDDQSFIDFKNNLLGGGKESDILKELTLVHGSYAEYCKARDKIKSYIFKQNEKLVHCKSYFDEDFLEIEHYSFDLFEFFDEAEIEKITDVYFENQKEDDFLLVIVSEGKTKHYFDYASGDGERKDVLFFVISRDINH